MVEGLIFDLYPNSKGEMIIWLKLEDGRSIAVTDRWKPKLYIAADDPSELDYLVERPTVEPLIESWSFEEKLERMEDREPRPVLALVPKFNVESEYLARQVSLLASFNHYRIYNADIPAAQLYLYEKEIFPFSRVNVEARKGGLHWLLQDSVYAVDYELPPLKVAWLEVTVAGGSIPKFTDLLRSINLEVEGERFLFDAGSEADKLLNLVATVSELDPDIIVTSDGDTFTLPYLAYRAHVNSLSSQFTLNRDGSPLPYNKREGSSYISYGRVQYRPATYSLKGRIHLDEGNTFIYDDCGFQGLVEVSRVCRIPIQTALRASIGKCMSSLQFYHALKDGRLVPWKATAAEKFKDAWSLLAADKGGFIFEPEVGLHENVGEIDFASLYPTIMAEKNISAETISCECCPDSPARVPELDYNICRIRGIVPKALDILLEKRRSYKQLMKQIRDSKLRQAYDERQGALKWVLVCCFGYLSFRNAKFGRIDAHMAVCAYARHILLEACRIAEARGFKVIHGIVDSLWLKKSSASSDDYLNLCEEISTKTGFRITLEGIYRWIAFIPSRMRSKIPVVNRYFGVFDDSSIKVRGIEARRSDTPEFIKRCQLEMLRTLAKGEDLDSATELIPDALNVLLEFARRLRSRDVPIEELLVRRRLTKNPWEYVTKGVGSIAAQQLIDEGMLLRAGQSVEYLITDYRSGLADRRVKAHRLIAPQTSYDVEKYLEMLSDAAWSILQPFGYSRVNLKRFLTSGSWQTTLAT